MSDNEILKALQTKAVELTELLRKKSDPYAAIIITDTEVKVVRTEYGVPIAAISSRGDKDASYQEQIAQSREMKST